jgi:hypothetical protein
VNGGQLDVLLVQIFNQLELLVVQLLVEISFGLDLVVDSVKLLPELVTNCTHFFELECFVVDVQENPFEVGDDGLDTVHLLRDQVKLNGQILELHLGNNAFVSNFETLQILLIISVSP